MFKVAFNPHSVEEYSNLPESYQKSILQIQKIIEVKFRQLVREKYGKNATNITITATSGYRSQKSNAETFGIRNSLHCRGDARDFVITPDTIDLSGFYPHLMIYVYKSPKNYHVYMRYD